MRIRSLHINGFGIFADTGIEELPHGLTVICGDNGAGKSTLLAFFRQMLFGFESGRNPQRYPPLRGGQHGGWLTLETRSGEGCRLERGPGPSAGKEIVVPLTPNAAAPSLEQLDRKSVV